MSDWPANVVDTEVVREGSHLRPAISLIPKANAHGPATHRLTICRTEGSAIQRANARPTPRTQSRNHSDAADTGGTKSPHTCEQDVRRQDETGILFGVTKSTQRGILDVPCRLLSGFPPEANLVAYRIRHQPVIVPGHLISVALEYRTRTLHGSTGFPSMRPLGMLLPSELMRTKTGLF